MDLLTNMQKMNLSNKRKERLYKGKRIHRLPEVYLWWDFEEVELFISVQNMDTMVFYRVSQDFVPSNGWLMEDENRD